MRHLLIRTIFGALVGIPKVNGNLLRAAAATAAPPAARCPLLPLPAACPLPAAHGYCWLCCSLARFCIVRSCCATGECATHCSLLVLCAASSLLDMTTDEARAIILAFMGGQFVERWPDEERQAIFGAHEFSYKQRRDVITFLYGNLRDSELVYAAVRPQLGPAHKAHDHARPRERHVRRQVPLLACGA